MILFNIQKFRHILRYKIFLRNTIEKYLNRTRQKAPCFGKHLKICVPDFFFIFRDSYLVNLYYLDKS